MTLAVFETTLPPFLRNKNIYAGDSPKRRHPSLKEKLGIEMDSSVKECAFGLGRLYLCKQVAAGAFCALQFGKCLPQ